MEKLATPQMGNQKNLLELWTAEILISAMASTLRSVAFTYPVTNHKKADKERVVEALPWKDCISIQNPHGETPHALKHHGCNKKTAPNKQIAQSCRYPSSPNSVVAMETESLAFGLLLCLQLMFTHTEQHNMKKRKYPPKLLPRQTKRDHCKSSIWILWRDKKKVHAR
jgi:hypothetical protein